MRRRRLALTSVWALCIRMARRVRQCLTATAVSWGLGGTHKGFISHSISGNVCFVHGVVCVQNHASCDFDGAATEHVGGHFPLQTRDGMARRSLGFAFDQRHIKRLQTLQQLLKVACDRSALIHTLRMRLCLDASPKICYPGTCAPAAVGTTGTPNIRNF